MATKPVHLLALLGSSLAVALLTVSLDDATPAPVAAPARPAAGAGGAALDAGAPVGGDGGVAAVAPAAAAAAAPQDVARLTAGLDGLPAGTVWAPGQLLVQADTPEALRAAAAAVDAPLVAGRDPRLGVVMVDGGPAAVVAARAALAAQAGIAQVDRNGLMRGASLLYIGYSGSGESFRALQWHLDEAGLPDGGTVHSRVAVLDSGVAHEDEVELSLFGGLLRYTAKEASTLDWTPVPHDHDFVDGDRHGTDAFWHGTHIASIIAGDGATLGGAPGAELLAYRVLDEHNVGTELQLIDAIHAAIDHRADIINMSLSFASGFRPSEALVEALAAADAAGIVMVGAAGNEGGVGVTWPAASRHVIAVGATCAADGIIRHAPYANRGSDVDLLAPGGCLDRDDNEDGYPDGILAEAFLPGEPTELGLFWAQGTSQAAAVVSAAAARLLDDGVDPRRVRELLQLSGHAVDVEDALEAGAPSIDLAGARILADALPAPLPAYEVAMLPWVEEGPDGVVPQVALLVVDDNLAPVDGVWVTGHVEGSSAGAFSCLTVDGVCLGTGPAAPGDAAGWRVTIGRVGDGLRGATPGGVMLLTPELGAFIDELSAAGELPALGFWMDETVVDSAVPGLTVIASGAGRSTAPYGVVVTAPRLAELGALTHTTPPTGGSPFSVVDIDLLGDGTTDIVAVNGSGVSTSPFGVRQADGPNSQDGSTTMSDRDGARSGEMAASSVSSQQVDNDESLAAMEGSSDLVAGQDDSPVVSMGAADNVAVFVMD